MVIDHIGIVVQSLEAGIKQWEKSFGYNQLTDIVINVKQKIKLVFLTKDNSITIKLIEPSDEKSPVFMFAKRGGGLHHLCFKCENLDSQIIELKSNDLRLIVEPQSGEAFGDNNIAFLLAKNNLNIELIDTDFKSHLK